jgi:DNA helicase-2/ATP-dependent DNA helicase PcrA
VGESRVVRGRIDAVYETGDGGWEIVDWKTGSPVSSDDPPGGLQMDLYGLAAVEAFGRPAGRITLTTAYLGQGELSREFDDASVRRARSRLDALLRELGASDWTATPGSHCAKCYYAEICPWSAAAD